MPSLYHRISFNRLSVSWQKLRWRSARKHQSKLFCACRNRTSGFCTAKMFCTHTSHTTDTHCDINCCGCLQRLCGFTSPCIQGFVFFSGANERRIPEKWAVGQTHCPTQSKRANLFPRTLSAGGPKAVRKGFFWIVESLQPRYFSEIRSLKRAITWFCCDRSFFFLKDSLL